METEKLKEAILAVIGECFQSNEYPDAPRIYLLLKAKGILSTGREVYAAVSALETEGKIARAPHYYTTGG